MEKKEEINNVEEVWVQLTKNKGARLKEMKLLKWVEWQEICCRAPLAGVGEDWVEIVIPHQVSSSASNLIENVLKIKVQR